MIAVHIYETDKEIIVSKLDSIIARADKKYFPYVADTVELLVEVLKGVGQWNVEVAE